MLKTEGLDRSRKAWRETLEKENSGRKKIVATDQERGGKERGQSKTRIEKESRKMDK